MGTKKSWRFDLLSIDKVAYELMNFFPSARFFAFYGEMGSGKTTFIQALCRCFGIAETVTSPTFAIVNEYRNKDEGRVFYHFDFYRVEKLEEAMDMGYEDYFYSGNTCFIEWPEKINGLLPGETLRFRIDVLDNEYRRLTII